MQCNVRHVNERTNIFVRTEFLSVISDSSERTALLKHERLELVSSLSDDACMCWF